MDTFGRSSPETTGETLSVTDDLLANNDAYAEGFDKGDLPIPPARKIAVLTCMDARLSPYVMLGLNEGDAHVIRNAGGVVTDDEIRSLAISQRLLGTEEIMLIHHTDCGMLKFTDAELKEQLERDFGVRPEWDSGAFTDLEANLHASMEKIRASPFIANKHSIRGFIYEVETGRLREIS